MSKIINGETASFDDVLQKENLVLVDFWAPWCGPCKMQTPILEKIVQSDAVDVTVVKVNTDENPDLAQKMNISSIPTLILFKNGKEVDKFIGLQPESVLINKITSLS
ncbi:MAG TPA: thioredoxin [Spirochaetota bacterium]|nr:thioredoxin [Spirochaetota bacterium]HPI87728.1 thioredoxin [Spirochaetota bacterium]HPR48147.1 thioredoxin [Spirochaetota bacterium]